jgi:DNA-binding MarR family transcriptional regulator
MRSSDRDVEASRCILALARAEDRMDRVLEAALAPVRLTPQKFNVLMEVAASPDGRLPLSEVGRRLIRSAANVTTLVDRLEADGFVRRVGDPVDGRVTLAEITQLGWRALRPAARAVFAAERRILRELSPDDRRRLTRLLEGVEPPPEGEVRSRRTDPPGADRFGAARLGTG